MKDNSKKQVDCQTVIYFSVYVLWCRKTNMHYVGITRQRVVRRIRQHKRGKQFIDREIQRIGWDEGQWDWWIVEENVPAEQISDCEQKWVKFFDCVFPKGYNKTCGGISKITVSDDTCEKIRQRALERDMSGERNPHYGKRHTDEAREAIRQSRLGKSSWNKGIPCSEEQKANLREKALARNTSGENNPFYGKHHTEEAREKNRQAHLGKPNARKGKKHKPESITKMRERALERDMSGERNPMYGKHQTTEAIEKTRQANLGRTPWNKGMKGVTHPTEETRAKMREAHLGQTPWNKGKKYSRKTAAKAAAQTTP